MKKQKNEGRRKFQLPSPSIPPSDPGLHANAQSVKSISSPDYWRKICPQLNVQNLELQGSCEPLSLPHDDLREAETRVKDDGYTDLSASQLPVSVRINNLALGVVQLMQHGWQASFISIYDEAWMLAHEVSSVMKEVTGNEINMDMLAWYIDPSRGDVGFSPHRDRQPDDSPSTFRPNGKAKYTTIWIPFTDATHDNSCLYVIPRPFDPGYFEGDDDSEDAADPLTVAMSSKEAYQCIRAVPLTAGSAVIFTHRTIHWGSRGRPGCTKPRISFSFGCAADDYEDAYFSRQSLPFPDHKLRLALACGQMIVYHERFNLSMSQLSLFNTIFKKEAHRFSPAYRSTVRFELIGTVKDVSRKGAGAGQGGQVAADAAQPHHNGNGSEDGSDEDVLDDMMDAMLDAKMKGLDAELEDDFDDVDDMRGMGADDDFEMSDGDDDDEDDDEDGRQDLLPGTVAKHPSLHGGLRQAAGPVTKGMAKKAARGKHAKTGCKGIITSPDRTQKSNNVPTAHSRLPMTAAGVMKRKPGEMRRPMTAGSRGTRSPGAFTKQKHHAKKAPKVNGKSHGKPKKR